MGVGDLLTSSRSCGRGASVGGRWQWEPRRHARPTQEATPVLVGSAIDLYHITSTYGLPFPNYHPWRLMPNNASALGASPACSPTPLAPPTSALQITGLVAAPLLT